MCTYMQLCRFDFIDYYHLALAFLEKPATQVYPALCLNFVTFASFSFLTGDSQLHWSHSESPNDHDLRGSSRSQGSDSHQSYRPSKVIRSGRLPPRGTSQIMPIPFHFSAVSLSHRNRCCLGLNQKPGCSEQSPQSLRLSCGCFLFWKCSSFLHLSYVYCLVKCPDSWPNTAYFLISCFNLTICSTADRLYSFYLLAEKGINRMLRP